MILNKNIIDATLEARGISEQAQKEAFLKAIEERIGELKKLTKHIADVMETYFYITTKDADLGHTVWSIICDKDKDYGLDFCNAISPDDKYGVHAHYAFGKGVTYKDIYITPNNVLTLRRGEFTIDYVRDYLSSKSASEYEGMYNSIVFMINAVPKYKEAVSKEIEHLFSSLSSK